MRLAVAERQLGWALLVALALLALASWSGLWSGSGAARPAAGNIGLAGLEAGDSGLAGLNSGDWGLAGLALGSGLVLWAVGGAVRRGARR